MARTGRSTKWTRMVAISLALTIALPVGAALAKKPSANSTAESGISGALAPITTGALVSPTTTSTTAPATVGRAPTTLFEVAQRIGLVDRKGRPLVEGTGRGVTIAMIDTGVVPVAGLEHSNVVRGPDFTPEDMYDDVRSLDTNGHGTHLAGIMVATDASWAAGDHRRTADRTLGIAPDATLVSIKAGSADGGTDISQVIAAINWVTAQKKTGAIDIDILSLAFSADSAQSYLTDPLTYAVEGAWKSGIVVVVAGGNEGQDQWRLTSPARDPFVIAVGATELTKKNETPAAYSSGGLLRPVDIHAPGSSIISLRNPGSWSDDYNAAGRVGESLVRGSGTSQATAVMAGAIAVLLEEKPEMTPDQVKRRLIEGADTVSTGDWLWPIRFANVDRAMETNVSTSSQWFPPAIGNGSLDEVRGRLRLSIDGVELKGEVDIFGNNWTGSRWTVDAWSGSRWTGSRWTTDTWAGTTWAGSRWTSGEWTGSRWTGSRWTGSGWTASRWTGSRWTGSRWTEASWD